MCGLEPCLRISCGCRGGGGGTKGIAPCLCCDEEAIPRDLILCGNGGGGGMTTDSLETDADARPDENDDAVGRGTRGKLWAKVVEECEAERAGEFTREALALKGVRGARRSTADNEAFGKDEGREEVDPDVTAESFESEGNGAGIVRPRERCFSEPA